MLKRSNFQTFTLKTIEGDEIYISCHTYEHATGWGHRGSIINIGNCWPDFTKRITYYNRTWEAFTYESLIYKLISEYFTGKKQSNNRAFIYAQIKAIAQRHAEEANAWADRFIKTFNALSDSTKEKIKNSNIILESTEQADALLKYGLMLEALQ